MEEARLVWGSRATIRFFPDLRFFPLHRNLVTMAKKKSATKSSKSAAIRDFQQNNSSSKPKDIAAALNKEGYKVTPQYVSMILSNDRRKSGKPAGVRGRKPKSTNASSATSPKSSKPVSMDALLAAKKLVRAVGGTAQARAAVDAYSKLIDG